MNTMHSPLQPPGGQLSFNTKRKKNDTNICGSGGKNAHIFNCKFIGELYDLEGCINSTNEFSTSSDRGEGQGFVCISATSKDCYSPLCWF